MVVRILILIFQKQSTSNRVYLVKILYSYQSILQVIGYSNWSPSYLSQLHQCETLHLADLDFTAFLQPVLYKVILVPLFLLFFLSKLPYQPSLLWSLTCPPILFCMLSFALLLLNLWMLNNFSFSGTSVSRQVLALKISQDSFFWSLIYMDTCEIKRFYLP